MPPTDEPEGSVDVELREKFKEFELTRRKVARFDMCAGQYLDARMQETWQAFQAGASLALEEARKIAANAIGATRHEIASEIASAGQFRRSKAQPERGGEKAMHNTVQNTVRLKGKWWIAVHDKLLSRQLTTPHPQCGDDFLQSSQGAVDYLSNLPDERCMTYPQNCRSTTAAIRRF
jgi:hypothetical protein